MSRLLGLGTLCCGEAEGGAGVPSVCVSGLEVYAGFGVTWV